MRLPIVIFFERHWDMIPKMVLKNSLPELKKLGYETLCMEAPQNLPSSVIIDRHKCGLEFDSFLHSQAQELLKQAGITIKLAAMSFSKLAHILRMYVSSKEYITVAERIKQLPASLLLKEIFAEAARLPIAIKGVDIDSESYDKMVSIDLSNRMRLINANEEHRITTICHNLLKISADQEKGILFSCGAIHADRLMAEFKKNNLHNRVIYYFPHSPSRFDDSLDDIQEITANTVLSDRAFLLSPSDIQPFKERMVSEILQRTSENS